MNRSEALKVLGVSSGFTEQELKSAYRKAVKKYHPDVGGDAQKFQMVQVAYELLQNGGGTGMAITQADLFTVVKR